MARYLTLVNGIPRLRYTPVIKYIDAYDVVGTITAGTTITIPNSRTYSDTDLRVEKNGQGLIPGVDYNYVGSTPKTQISLVLDITAPSRLTFITSSPPITAHIEYYDVVGTITAGTTITIPNGISYASTDLMVEYNGQGLVPGLDYNYVGSAPRTQISLTFNVSAPSRIIFRTSNL